MTQIMNKLTSSFGGKIIKNVLKNLYRLVSRYLCIPATSCPSERIFSKAGEIISVDRSRLSPKHANELIFCSENEFV